MDIALLSEILVMLTTGEVDLLNDYVGAVVESCHILPLSRWQITCKSENRIINRQSMFGCIAVEKEIYACKTS